MTLSTITRSGNILCILFLVLLVSCDYALHLQVNQTESVMLKSKDCSVLIKAYLFKGGIHLDHQLDKNKCQFNVDSLKLLEAETHQDIIRQDCKRKPCPRITYHDDTDVSIRILPKIFSANTVYLLPCNYISCNGKMLTDTLRIQIPPRVKR